MNFPNSRDYQSPYVFREYPKWVTLADGSQMIAQNAEEEAVLVGEQPSEESKSAREALFEEARALGLNPHHRTGDEKLAEMIKQARGE